jgi:hypothetical protein
MYTHARAIREHKKNGAQQKNVLVERKKVPPAS